MRLLIATGISFGILGVLLWMLNVLATPGPEEPNPEDVAQVAVGYKCTVCGTRLVVTHAQLDGEMSAPRHCRESMIEFA